MILNRDTLKVARQACGWTQAKLGRAVGVGSGSVSHYESGIRNLDDRTVRAWHDALPIDEDELAALLETQRAIRERSKDAE